MFIIDKAFNTCKVSGSVVTCIIPVVALTIEAFLVELLGPTSTMTSKDALGFGHMRTPTTSANLIQSRMEDPETGKVYDVAPEVAKAINRDYTALMKKITQQK